MGQLLFPISPQKHMLWVLIRSTLGPTTYIVVEKYFRIEKRPYLELCFRVGEKLLMYSYAHDIMEN